MTMNAIIKAIIEVNGLCFSIGESLILKDISFRIIPGEYISVIGPNGSGKTTLLKCLDRIYTPQKGDIRINAKSINAYRQKALAKMMGYVPQSTGQSYPFSVYEFVLMGRYPFLNPFTPPKREDHEAVLDALRLTDMEAFSHRIMGTLSGGERQKILIAAALAQGSRILLLDEPTTFLDPKHQDEVQEILLRINKESEVTIIASTHDINSALSASDRIIAIKKGEIIFSGTPDELIKKGLLKRIYDRSFVLMTHPLTNTPVVL